MEDGLERADTTREPLLWIDRFSVYEASRALLDELSIESGDGCSLLAASLIKCFPNGPGIPVTWLTQPAMDNSSVT